MSVSYSLRDIDSSLIERERSLSSRIDAIVESNSLFEMPSQIGQYSLIVDKENDTRKVIFDDSTLSYLWLPPRNESFAFDLSESYEKYKHINWCSAANVKLDEFLQWILHNRSMFPHDASNPIGVDFLTYRGVLTKLMVTPFVKDKWLIGATKFKGTIYLCPYYEDEKPNEFGNLFSFGGLRFENYITRTDPNKVNREPFTSEKNEFSVVMKSKLQSTDKKISLLYAAEVDCLDLGRTDPSIMDNFVEIKTTKRMHHENQHRNFKKFKLIKWWAQSYLVGVPKIICGYKNDRHSVDQIEHLNVHQIPQQCNQFWSRRQCFNFLKQFLSFVQQLVVDDDPNRVYLFSNEYADQITAKKLLLSGHFQILPEWYIKELDKQQII